MPGIGDKPLLVLHIFHKGLNGKIAQKAQHQDVQQHADKPKAHRVAHKGFHRSHIPGAVHHYYHIVPARLGGNQRGIAGPFFFKHALLLLVLQHLVNDFQGFLLVKGRNVGQVQLGDLAVGFIHKGAEISGLVGKFRGIVVPFRVIEPAAPAFRRQRNLVGRHHTAVLGNDVQEGGHF